MEKLDPSSSSTKQPNLPPGFRFHPTDEELVVHYLKRKASAGHLPISIIAEVDLYKFDPWELPAKAAFGEQEWYFFSPRDRKYPNGARPNRAATSGYWKATGTDKPVLSSGGTQKVGVKKALVFYGGKPPKGTKTNWIMHEYRLTDSKSSRPPPPPCDKKSSLRLDDWVLCRIYKKNGGQRGAEQEVVEDVLGRRGVVGSQQEYTALLETERSLMEGMMGGGGGGGEMASSSGTCSVVGGGYDMKRAMSSFYWDGGEEEVVGTMSKRLQTGGVGEEDGGGNVLASLLDQLRQQQMEETMQGDGVLRQVYHHQQHLPGMNWYT